MRGFAAWRVAASHRTLGEDFSAIRYPLKFRSGACELGVSSSRSLPQFRTSARASLHRVPSGRFPGFIGYYCVLGLLVAPTLLAVRSAWQFHRSRGGDGEVSRVPGEPSRTCPALRPRSDRCTRPSGFALPLRVRCCLPHFRLRRLRLRLPYEAPSHGLHARCLRFVATVARYCLPATQDSLPAGGPPCRAGFEPAGFQCEVSVLLPHRFLLTQALPGAPQVESRKSRERERQRDLETEMVAP